jgi:hypothetical protein
VFVYLLGIYHTGFSIFGTEYFYCSDGVGTCEPVREYFGIGLQIIL